MKLKSGFLYRALSILDISKIILSRAFYLLQENPSRFFADLHKYNLC